MKLVPLHLYQQNIGKYGCLAKLQYVPIDIVLRFDPAACSAGFR
jgi:hypothetical protein